MIEVYVDTSVIFPLIDRDDDDHARVVAAMSGMKASTQIVTSSYAVLEVSALVRARLGMRQFRALGDVIDELDDIVWVDEALHRRAWTEAAKAGRNGPSLVDWVGFLVMRDRGIETALAIDNHFNEHGFKTLP